MFDGDNPDHARRVQFELFLRSLSMAKPTPEVARQVAGAVREVFFQEGETLYEEGGDPDRVFFILRGEVELLTPDHEPWRFGSGAMIGVLDHILERPHARRAVALTDVHGMELAAEDYEQIMEDNFDYALRAMFGVAADLHQKSLGLAPSGGYPEPPPPPAGDGDATEMGLVERVAVLRGSVPFGHASIQSLARLAQRFEPVRLTRGEVLFEPGCARGVLYVVAHGHVEVERVLSPRIVARFGRGDLVCGFSAIGETEVEYRAHAVTDHVIALEIEEEALVDVMEDHYDVLRSILRGLAAFRERLLGLLAAGPADASDRATAAGPAKVDKNRLSREETG